MAKLIETLTSNQEKDIYRKIARFCAYRERAASEVKNKLISLDVSRDLINKLVELLKKDKFLDNKRFARFYAQGKFLNNKWGKQKIKANLQEKKINATEIDFALNEIDEKHYFKTIKTLIDKKSKSLKEKNLFIKRKKIVNFLRLKGYEADIVWNLVKNKFPV